MKLIKILSFVLAAVILQKSILANSVNVYSARKAELIKPLLDKFSEQTGIETNLITAKANALITRMQTEGVNSQADILITTDAGRLNLAKEKDLLQELDIDNINIDKRFIDQDNKWIGLSKRARVIFYNPQTVDIKDLSTYEALADDKFNGRICIRSSSNIYNQSLISSMIHNLGEEKTEEFLEGFVNNFARKPQGGDRDQIKAVANGKCDIAIANTYYYGAMLSDDKDPKQKQAAQKVSLFWPNQNTTGTHINISGAGIAKYSKNKENAQKLIEFLLEKEAQEFYAEVNFEEPVVSDVKPSELIASWGEYKDDNLKLSTLAYNNTKATRLMDRAGWR